MHRPNEWSANVAPVIRTPAHGSFPSGHATESFAAAAVLSAVFPDRMKHLRTMATRIAMNRCYAGVHYPIDQYAGAILGDVIGGMVVWKLFGSSPFKNLDAGTALKTTSLDPEFSITPPTPAPAMQVTGAAVTVEKYAQDVYLLKKPSDLIGGAASELLGHLAGLVRNELDGLGQP
jgi:hypothetical protein